MLSNVLQMDDCHILLGELGKATKDLNMMGIITPTPSCIDIAQECFIALS